MSVRRPVRLLDVSELSKAYPLELLADFATGDFTLVKSDGSTITHKNTSIMTGASASTAGTGGLVPAPSAGAQTYFLRGDGKWADVSTLNSATATTAESAAKLTNKVALKIGSTSKDFDGSTGLSWTLAEIGAASSTHNHDTVYSKLGHTHAADEFVVAEATHAESADSATNATNATNADKATAMATDRTFTIGSAAAKSFNGNTALTWTLADIGAAAASHNHDSVYLKLAGGTVAGNILASKSGLSIGSSTIPFTNIYATTFTGTLSGNASTATKLAAPVNIGITGLTATAASFDGSKAVDIAVTAIPASLLTGTIDVARLPAGALERLVTVTDETARFALTTDTVQTGDTVKQTDTNTLYYVVDDTKLSSAAGYVEYAAGTATKALSADTAAEATHAASADNATNATNATNASKATAMATDRTFTIGSAAAKSFNSNTALSWTLADIGAAAADHTHSAYVNQNAFSKVTVGSTTLSSSSTTDTLTLAAGSNVTLTASGKTVTIAATDTTYAQATSSVLGLVKIGYTGSGQNYPVELNSNGQMYVNVPWTDTDTTYDIASSTTLGLVRTGYSTSGKNYAVQVNSDGDMYVNVPWTDTTYGAATSTILGLVRTGYTTSGKNYAVQTDDNGNMYVNVPWTDNDTTYGAATSSTYGLLKIGYTTSGKNYAVQLSDGKAFVNVPWTDTTYSIMSAASASTAGTSGLVPAPAAGDNSAFLRGDGTWAVPTNTTYNKATADTLGLVKIGYAASGKNYAVQTDDNGNMYVNVPWTDTTYAQASADDLGLVKVGYNASGKNYAVQLDSNGAMYVNVPWTDTNTTYTLSSFGIDATATELNYMAGVTSNVQTQLNDKAASSHGTHVTFSTTAPAAAGTATVGTATTVSRSDHVHPLQTTVSGNAGSATKLATARTIDGVSFNGTAAISHYGVCSTAAATAAKTVACTGFTLVTGARIIVKFSNTNSAASPTLNVNSTGAKDIYYDGAAITASYLTGGRLYEFVYNGTQFDLIGEKNINTDTRVTQTITEPTSSTKWYLLAGTSASTNTAASVKNADLRANMLEGTTSAAGKVELVLGNSTATGTAGNKYGFVTLYSEGTSYHVIKPSTTSSAITHMLPAVSGTILNSGALVNGTTESTRASAAITTTASRQYAVEYDSNGKLSVNVPWANTISSYTKTGTSTAAGWYRIATSALGIVNCVGLFRIKGVLSGYHTNAIITAGSSYGNATGTTINVLHCSSWSTSGITQARIVYNTSYSGNYAYLEVYAAAANMSIEVEMLSDNGWTLTTIAAGSIPDGYTSRAVTLNNGGFRVGVAGKAYGIAVQYAATVTTTWTGSAAPYTQTITVTGITASDVPIVDFTPSGTYATDKSYEEAFANIYRITTAANSITVYAHEKTTVALPIRLRCIR